MKLHVPASQQARSWAVGKGGVFECRNSPSSAFLIVVELCLDHADDNIIADETALVHDLLGFAA